MIGCWTVLADGDAPFQDEVGPQQAHTPPGALAAVLAIVSFSLQFCE